MPSKEYQNQSQTRKLIIPLDLLPDSLALRAVVDTAAAVLESPEAPTSSFSSSASPLQRPRPIPCPLVDQLILLVPPWPSLLAKRPLWLELRSILVLGHSLRVWPLVWLLAQIPVWHHPSQLTARPWLHFHFGVFFAAMAIPRDFCHFAEPLDSLLPWPMVEMFQLGWQAGHLWSRFLQSRLRLPEWASASLCWHPRHRPQDRRTGSPAPWRVWLLLHLQLTPDLWPPLCRWCSLALLTHHLIQYYHLTHACFHSLRRAILAVMHLIPQWSQPEASLLSWRLWLRPSAPSPPLLLLLSLLRSSKLEDLHPFCLIPTSQSSPLTSEYRLCCSQLRWRILQIFSKSQHRSPSALRLTYSSESAAWRLLSSSDSFSCLA